MKSNSHSHIYKCLGKVVKIRRKRLGMSQDELAQEAGVDRAFISNIENGQRSPSFGTVSALANGLKMRYSRLVHNCEECLKRETDKAA